VIVIVGHGPSAYELTPNFLEKHTVIRLGKDERPKVQSLVKIIGNKADIICSFNPSYQRKNAIFWCLAGPLRQFCIDKLKPFNPAFAKPSTGVSAALIARDKYPESEIAVSGFDITLNPETAPQGWVHDSYAEKACLNTLKIIEL
tara:strand:+ start:3174 stop:3608 length:435 start_codon:yes stop_codon:yes gene_type:complete